MKNKLKDKNVYRIGIAGAILIVAISFINGFIPVVKKYNIETKKELNKKLKIVVISDIHLSNISVPFYWRKVVNKVNRLNPDVIIIAGDMIDTDAKWINQEKYRDIFSKLKSKDGVYAVTGNHEYYGNLERNIKFIESCNIKMLKDKYVNIEQITVAGREDRHNWSRKNLTQIIKDVDKKRFLIVAEHNPSNLKESIENRVDLQVSGHTHNGQFFPWNIPTHYMYEKSKGRINRGNTDIIVSSGIGGWGPLIRNCSRPEIVEINIEGDKK